MSCSVSRCGSAGELQAQVRRAPAARQRPKDQPFPCLCLLQLYWLHPRRLYLQFQDDCCQLLGLFAFWLTTADEHGHFCFIPCRGSEVPLIGLAWSPLREAQAPRPLVGRMQAAHWPSQTHRLYVWGPGAEPASPRAHGPRSAVGGGGVWGRSSLEQMSMRLISKLHNQALRNTVEGEIGGRVKVLGALEKECD